MHLALWIVHVVLALMFLLAGITKAFRYDQAKATLLNKRHSHGAWRTMMTKTSALRYSARPRRNAWNGLVRAETLEWKHQKGRS
jgi:hypothetical protein